MIRYLLHISRLFYFRHLILFVGIVMSVIVPVSLSAHPTPSSIVLLDIKQKNVSAELQLPLSELAPAFGHDVDIYYEHLTERLGPELKAYIQAHIRPVSTTGKPWQVTVTDLSVTKNTQSATGPYRQLIAHVILTPPDTSSSRNFILKYDVIIHQVVTHQVLVRIRQDWENGLHGDQPAELGVISMDRIHNTIPPLIVSQQMGSTWKGFTSMVRLGMSHIAEGVDHLLFLLVLLLPAPLLAMGRKWGSFGGTRYSIIRLLKIVTAFTIGHTITLIAGSLGWLHLPSSLIEMLIAVSILVSAVHAMRPVFPGREVFIAGGFGLIHGSAFASTLSNLNLETGRLALSILGFNLGIELMQLFVILLIVPSFIILSKTSIYSFIRIGGAVFAAIAAIGWMAERILKKSNFITGITQHLSNFSPYIVTLFAMVAMCSLFLKNKNPASASNKYKDVNS